MSKEDLVIRINDEERYLIRFPVGDWSADGHGKCDHYLITSRKPTQEVREAHFKAKDVFGFDIGDICGEYEENQLEETVRKKLEETDYKFDTFSFTYAKENGEENPTLGSEDVIAIWLHLLNNVDPSLDLKQIEPSDIHFSGYDDQKRHLATPGYGVFYD